MLFRRATQTQLKNAVHGLRIAGGFSFCLAGRFLLCGAFSFCGCVFLYAVFVFGRSDAFLSALRACFRVCFASPFPFLRCDMPVEAQILLVRAFCGVGSVFICH